MAVWSTHLNDLPPETDASVPAAARRRAAFTRAVVEAATSRLGEGRWRTAVRCIKRVGHKACMTPIEVTYDGVDSVAWSCAACSERGVVTGFIGSDLDLSIYFGLEADTTWGMDGSAHEMLLAATKHIPELRSVVARAAPHDTIPGLLLLRATLDELDDLYTLVEHLEGATRSPSRRDLLAGLRASLCTAMDGF